MKKVLIVTEHFLPKLGGIEKSIYCISQELIKKNYEVTVLTNSFGVYKAKESINGINVKRVTCKYNGYNILYPFKLYFSFKKKLQKEKLVEYDFILARDAVSAAAALNLTDKKVIFLPGSINRNYSKMQDVTGLVSIVKNLLRSLRYKFYYILEKNVVKKSPIVMTYSENFKNEIQTEIFNRKIFVNKPGITYIEKTKKEENIRKKHNIADEELIFLFLGKLIKVKNVDMIINAFLDAKISNSKLLIVGDGDQKQHLQKMIPTDRKNDILFEGVKKNVFDYYKAADYFLASAVYEPFGFVILESLISKTPVIGFKRNFPTVKVAVEEMIVDNYNGIIIKNFTAEALKTALEKAAEIKKTSKYNDFKNNTVKISETYNWDNFTSNLIKIAKDELESKM